MRPSPALPTLAPALALALLAAGCANPAPRVEELSAAPASPSCGLPATAPDPSAGFEEFSDYSWQVFAAVNRPVTPGQRGEPDCARPMGSPGPTVWQSYKTVDQVFLPGAADPGPWNAGGMDSALRFQAKAPDELPLEESIDQAVGGWLIDQAGNPTYYQIAVNQTSYEYIRGNRYYNADTVSRARNLEFPDGALEVKAAWRILPAGADSGRYVTTVGQVMVFDSAGNPTGRYRMARLGLTGLHVVYKAPGFPQWTWATFEHVDNAPLQGDTTGRWSYYSAGCTGPYCKPNVSPKTAHVPFGVPNPIVRITPIGDAVAASNAAWQARLAGTPFQHYQLVSPQWPSEPDNPGIPDGAPVPGTVANVVMESYIQPISSCMDCHSTARVPGGAVKSNYSFLFLFAQSPTSQGTD